MLGFFHSNPNSHLRRAMELLREANLARIEHQAAAEHHAALARMYSERAQRLQHEIRETAGAPFGEAGLLQKEPEDKATLYALDGSRRGEEPPKVGGPRWSSTG